MGNIRLYLRANEKIYINGAVIRFDRKTSIELLNDVSFLLENHVMQVEDAKTPMRQLYFVVQMMLMDPANIDAPKRLFDSMIKSLSNSVTNPQLREGICAVEADIGTGDTFKALKTIRGLFEVEAKILEASEPQAAALPSFEEAVALQEGA